MTPVATDTSESALLAERFAAVKALQQQGLSVRTIARQLGMNRRTVSRYSVHRVLPVRSLARQNTSSWSPYMDYLWRRRQEGCTMVAQLHQELIALGFKGSYHVVWRVYQHLPQLAAGVEAAPLRPLVKPLGSRKAAWLLSQAKQRLKPEDQQLLDALCQTNVAIATAHQLTQTFQRLVRERCAANSTPASPPPTKPTFLNSNALPKGSHRITRRSKLPCRSTGATAPSRARLTS